MLSLAAAGLAPFWTMSQKVSPWREWVTMAILIRGPPPPRPFVAFSSAFFPPEPLHALSASNPARPWRSAFASYVPVSSQWPAYRPQVA